MDIADIRTKLVDQITSPDSMRTVYALAGAIALERARTCQDYFYVAVDGEIDAILDGMADPVEFEPAAEDAEADDLAEAGDAGETVGDEANDVNDDDSETLEGEELTRVAEAGHTWQLAAQVLTQNAGSKVEHIMALYHEMAVALVVVRTMLGKVEEITQQSIDQNNDCNPEQEALLIALSQNLREEKLIAVLGGDAIAQTAARQLREAYKPALVPS